MTEKIVYCKICNSVRAFTHCLGCGLPVCDKCACPQDKDSGHEGEWSIYYCPACISDPAVNPDAVLRKKKGNGS